MKPVTIAITKLDKAFHGAARSYEVSITNGKDPLMQLHGSDNSVENTLKQSLVDLKRYKRKLFINQDDPKMIIYISTYKFLCLIYK